MPEESQWREEIRRRLEGLALPSAREAEIIDELAEHLEEDYQRATGRGASDAEARREALAGLSDHELFDELRAVERPAGPEPVIAGDARRANTLSDLFHDVRYAMRMFRKNPGFTALAILSLALGIGANTAIFSLISAALLRPLPYPEPYRLVQAASTGYYPPGGVVALQQQSRTMDLAGFRPGIDLNLTGQGDAWRVTGSTVSANLFTVLGLEAERGRTFHEGDDQPGKDNLVILSHSMWQDRFGGDAGMIGRVITLGGVDRQVVGIMPAGFSFPDAEAKFWIPLRLDPRDQTGYWAQTFMPVVARLRDGATLEQAQQEIQSLSRQMIALYPYPMGRDFNAQATVVPLQQFQATNVRGRLILLQCAIGLVLLIACANVANLLLARAGSRQKEMALRTALGAAPGRIIRQVLTESVLLALAGGAAGVSLAGWGASALRLLVPAGASGWSDVSLDWRVLLLAGVLSVASGLAFGLAPALMASGHDLAALIKSGGQRSGGTVNARLRSTLIVAELALAVVLSVGAGLLIRSLWSLAQVNPGFEPRHTLTLRISPNQSLCRERAACIALYDELLRRAQTIPGVYDLAAVNTLPLSGNIPTLPVEVEGQPFVPSEKVAPLVWAGAVTPDYFRVMRIPIVAGRGFAASETEQSEPVIVVSAATARRYWPNENPIGKHIRPVSQNIWRTVIGVAGDVRQYDLANRSPDFIQGAMYMPYSQSIDSNRVAPAAMTLIARTGADPADVAGRIRELVRDVNPNVPVSEVRTMESLVTASTQPSRAMAWLFAGFAGVALLLAAIGAYGVVSWWTAQRTFEIGMRVALGSSRRAVFTLVIGQSLRLVIAGLVLGVAGSFLLTRMLGAFLYGTASWDLLTLSSVSGLLLAVALVAGYVPARRAAGVDPLTALRME